jgi:hypothetical protein
MDTIVVKRASLQDSDYVRDLFLQARLGRPVDPNREAIIEASVESIEEHDIVLVAVQCMRGVLQYLGYAQLCPCSAELGEKGWSLGELFVLPDAERGRVEQALLMAVTKYVMRQDMIETMTESNRSIIDPYPYAENA